MFIDDKYLVFTYWEDSRSASISHCACARTQPAALRLGCDVQAPATPARPVSADEDPSRKSLGGRRSRERPATQKHGHPAISGTVRSAEYQGCWWPKTALQSRASHSLTRKASPTLSCIKQLPRLPIVPAACRLSPMPSRFMSTAFEPPPDDDDDAHWEARFLQATQTIPPSSASHA
eukprot:6194777-Pleurochrysis_carterae.AAC.1